MLTIDSITLTYGEAKILSGCYLEGKKGEVIGLLGRNGSGKSSLLKIIFGTIKPEYKHLRIDNKIIDKGYLSGKICYLPQDPFLPPFLKVSSLVRTENIEDKEIREFLLKLSSSIVSELSGGELRILECLWIMQQPAEYILLDEPFSGASPILVELLQKIIRDASSQKCIILTDHMYRALLPISDRVLLLHNKAVYPIKNEKDLSFYGYIPDA